MIGFVAHVIGRGWFWLMVYLLLPFAQAIEAPGLLRDAWRDWKRGARR